MKISKTKHITKDGVIKKNPRPVIRASGTGRVDREVIYKYLDDVIYSDDEELIGRTAKANYVRDRFESEFDFRIKQIGYHNALTEWLQGLAINIEYMNYSIIELAKKWGSIPQNASERIEDKIIDGWFGFMATKIEQYIAKYATRKN